MAKLKKRRSKKADAALLKRQKEEEDRTLRVVRSLLHNLDRSIRSFGKELDRELRSVDLVVRAVPARVPTATSGSYGPSRESGRLLLPRPLAEIGATSRGASKMAAKEVDAIAARELVLFIDTDGDLRQQKQAFIENLDKKRKRGVFDREKSVRLWEYFADEGARAYKKEFHLSGGSSFGPFDKATRHAVAEHYAGEYIDAVNESELRREN